MPNDKGLSRNKVNRIDAVTLFFIKAQNPANSRAILRFCNEEKGQKNKSKCLGYFVTSPKLQNYLHFHFIVFLWGFTAVLGALITIDAVPLVWYRMLLAAIFIFLWLIWKKKNLRLSRGDMWTILAAGIVIALHWLGFFGAIKLSNVSITLSIMASGALFTALLEPIFYHRKLIWYELVFGLLVIMGLFIIFKVETEYFLGMLLALAAAFLGAVFTLINGKLIKRADASVISFYELAIGALAISAYLLFLTFFGETGSGFSPGFFSLSLPDWGYLLILASVCTAYAFVVSVKVMKYISPYTVMLTTNLEPIYGILLAVIIFGSEEKMSPGFYFGTFLILTTVILNGILKTKRKTP